MITTEGKIHLKRYLAGFVPALAASIAIGSGATAEAVGNTRLAFENERVDILLSTFDFVNNNVVFKAELPAEYSGTVYEVGLYALGSEDSEGAGDSRLITTFDSATEDWLDSAGVSSAFSTSTRIGADAMRQTPAASATREDFLGQLEIDLSEYSGSDTLVFSYLVNNSNASGLRFRFFMDSSNYFEFALGSQTSGYKIVERTKASATVTGAPNWASITQISVATTSGSGGASSIDFDGIRVENTDTINPDNVLISRKVLATPIQKIEGNIQEIEFALAVNV